MTNNAVISFRMDKDMLKTVDSIARQFHMSRGKALRSIIAVRLPSYHPIQMSEADRNYILAKLGPLTSRVSMLLSDWSHVSDNINQIAHRLNATNQIDLGNFYNLLEGSNGLTIQNKELDKGVTKLWQLLE